MKDKNQDTVPEVKKNHILHVYRDREIVVCEVPAYGDSRKSFYVVETDPIYETKEYKDKLRLTGWFRIMEKDDPYDE